ELANGKLVQLVDAIVHSSHLTIMTISRHDPCNLSCEGQLARASMRFAPEGGTVKLTSIISSGLALAVTLTFAQPAHAQAGATGTPATPTNGTVNQTQPGNGNGVPSDPGTQGTTDRQGSTNQVPTGTSGQPPSGTIGGQSGSPGANTGQPVDR